MSVTAFAPPPLTYLNIYWQSSFVCFGLDKHSLAARLMICSLTASCCNERNSDSLLLLNRNAIECFSYLGGERLGHDAENVRRQVGDSLFVAVLSEQPENGGTRLGHGYAVNHASHLADDFGVRTRLCLQQFLDNDDALGHNQFCGQRKANNLIKISAPFTPFFF